MTNLLQAQPDLESEKKEEERKTERPKKYAAIDALILPAKARRAGSLHAASHELLTALPGAIARSNFARVIPQDGRIELNFDFPWKQHGAGFRGREYQNRFLSNEDQLSIEALESFWGTIQTYGHLVIWDTIPRVQVQKKWTERYFMYNIGHDSPYGVAHADIVSDNRKEERLGYHTILSQQKKVRELLNRNRLRHDDTSKRRIIICQGLPLVLPAMVGYVALPFLVMNSEDDPISRAVNLHILCQRRPSSEATNPYSNLTNAFHITFYEMLPRDGPDDLVKVSRQKKLKIGYLYGKPDRNSSNATGKNNGPAFRESSFTTPDYIATAYYKWTALVLSSSNFFKEPAQDNLDINWKSVLSEARFLIAETTIIVAAIRKVEDRWRDLNEYIGSLLVEDFMDPKSFVMLLFDDETFSRSRLYFWVIGCLNEFDISIEDNIKQWKLFRQALIDPRIEKLRDILSETEDEDYDNELYVLLDLYRRGEEVRQGLEDLQSQFRAKLATVQTLRDGLFNASALIESRSSTRLSQNVKLLTYVSIVYLPLAFCAALWAVPNISNNDTRTPFIITTFLVGCATYIVVFNLESIVNVLGKFYTGYRSRLLESMSEDHDSYWQSLREQFEEFPPNNEQRKPSEWWIIRYQLQKWFRRAN